MKKHGERVRYTRLKNNLKVALVLEEVDANSTATAASYKAAMITAINAGHLSNPPECGGLAHLTEHGSQLGSEAHKGLCDFVDFQTKNDIEFNAVTFDTKTVYTAEMPQSSLMEYCKRQIDCLARPLYIEERIDKEVSVLTCEHLIKGYDNESMVGNILRECAVNESPNAIFRWGNRKSLLQDQSVSLDQALHHRKKVYHMPNNAAVVVKIADDAKLVHELLTALSEWPTGTVNDNNNDEVARNENVDVGEDSDRIIDLFNTTFNEADSEMEIECNDLFPTERFQRVYNVKSSLPALCVCIQLPKIFGREIYWFFRNSILSDHKGGLKDLLRKRRFGWDINVEPSNNLQLITSGDNVVSILVQVSNRGIHHYQDIVQLIYSFLKSIIPLSWSTLQKHYYRFRRSTTMNGNIDIETLEMISVHCIDKWRNDLHYKDASRNINPNHIKEFVTHLINEPFCLIMFTKTLPHENRRQPFTGHLFCVSDISQELIKRCKDLSDIDREMKPVEKFIRSTGKQFPIPEAAFNTSSFEENTSNGYRALKVTSPEEPATLKLVLRSTQRQTTTSAATIELLSVLLKNHIMDLHQISNEDFKIATLKGGNGLVIDLRENLTEMKSVADSVVTKVNSLSAQGIDQQSFRYYKDMSLYDCSGKMTNSMTTAREITTRAIYSLPTLSEVMKALRDMEYTQLQQSVTSLRACSQLDLIVYGSTTRQHLTDMHSEFCKKLCINAQPTLNTTTEPSFSISPVFEKSGFVKHNTLHYGIATRSTAHFKHLVLALICKEYLNYQLIRTIRTELCISYAPLVHIYHNSTSVLLLMEVSFCADKFYTSEVIGELEKLQREFPTFVSSLPSDYYKCVTEKVRNSLEREDAEVIASISEAHDMNYYSKLKAQLSKVSRNIFEDFCKSLSAVTDQTITEIAVRETAAYKRAAPDADLVNRPKLSKRN